ncbi:MAG TPA: Gfo/Idh/MocA family oxidoreductase [Chthonomonas sp.]|uniref:Gfo/Idh/MocA family protein n=1 Tax=Chthonomonas sp. TaxID=2282153 RepID=UPI002B4AF3CE|nr:Gfo/Idh/MocA family oxidoreductase [Chthonomonas sp.]HLH81259.1 Gfo/Idh/MocA family oxidoreductase [Chthonomonas sp.]
MGLSIGVVGLGSFGSLFAELFCCHPAVSRIALCDREPDRIARLAEQPLFQKKFRPEDGFTSLEALCNSDVDAVAIFTQHWLHAPQAIFAMERGKHVYSAVPLISIPYGDEILEWCERLIATCRRTGMSYMLGETTYFHPGAMFCRRQAAMGAFGAFIYAEGEYLHSFDSLGCDLRVVMAHRLASQAGKEWQEQLEKYRQQGAQDSPMHYPTHSTSGPICVMRAHAVKVSAWGTPSTDPYFQEGLTPFSNVTALFKMSNGATMRICEHRHCSILRETFRIYGTDGSYENGVWVTKERAQPLTAEEMRDPLPPEVWNAYVSGCSVPEAYLGHEGSHGYLVHEFVSALEEGRRPAIHAWEAVRYTVPGVMAHKSALRDGEVLTVPDWGDPP